MSKENAGNGTIMKKSRAFYATIPKDVLKLARLQKGDRVHVTFNTHYNQVIITKERYADETIPFRNRNAGQSDAFGTG